jgi:hypothetical protein
MRTEPGPGATQRSAGRRLLRWSTSRPVCLLVSVGLLSLLLLRALDAVVAAQQRPWPLVLEDASVTPVVRPTG